MPPRTAQRQRRRQRLRLAGLCVQCGREANFSRRCVACQTKFNEARKRWKYYKNRGAAKGLAK